MEGHKQPETTFNGFYLAEVIDVDDSPNTTGRVKVRVFPMMLGLSEAVLPWAVPAFGLFEGAAANQGSFAVPAENSRVWVFFAAGDVRSPVYFANAPGATDGPTGRTPTKKMWRTRSGHQIEIEDVGSAGYIKVTHRDGAVIEMDSTGNVVVTAKASSEVRLGAGGTVQKLLNEAAATLFNAHTHGPGTFTAGGNPVVGVSATPGTTMGATEETAETKAS